MAAWMVSVPVSDLLAMQELPKEMEKLQNENAQLRKEFEALRRMNFELMEQFGEFKRELMGR